MRKFWQTGLFVLPILLMPPVAQADTAKQPATPTHQPKTAPAVQRLGAAGGWSAYTYKDRAGQVCYVLGFPVKRQPPNGKRKPSVMMVTHRPQEHVADVVSLDEGSHFKEGSDASLDVDGTKFDLFTKADTAWSRTPDLDKAIVAAMTKGSRAAIAGTSQKGPPISDTYSLGGFSRALALIDKACGITR
jgi:hypothetical protein